MACPNCGASIPDAGSFCVECGRRLRDLCPHCGAEYAPGHRYCRSCGAYLLEQPQGPVSPPPSRDITCPRCHSVNAPNAAYCYSCGLPFDEQRRIYDAELFPAGRPAGFWIRVLAAVIDTAFLVLANLLLVAIWPGEVPAQDSPFEIIWTWQDSVSLVIGAAYHTLALSMFSTTIGKRVVGIYVLRPDGSKVGVGRAFARYLATWLSGFLLFAGYLMVAFRQDKRGLHDLICDTVVVFPPDRGR